MNTYENASHILSRFSRPANTLVARFLNSKKKTPMGELGLCPHSSREKLDREGFLRYEEGRIENKGEWKG